VNEVSTCKEKKIFFKIKIFNHERFSLQIRNIFYNNLSKVFVKHFLFSNTVIKSKGSLMNKLFRNLIILLFAFVMMNVVNCDKDKKQNDSEIDKIVFGSVSKDMDYILPSPAQLFNSLEKGKNINWKGLVVLNKNTNYTSDVQLALNIGARSADGLVSVYANDMKMAKDLWMTINDLAQRLNLDESLSETKKTLKKAIDAKDMKALRQSLDVAHSATEKALKIRKDNDLAVLVSLGGWLEGMYLTSKGLVQTYDNASAKLLRQGDLVGTFIKRISKMNNTIKNQSSLKTIIIELPKVKKLVDVKRNKAVSKKNVLKLFNISKIIKKAMEG